MRHACKTRFFFALAALLLWVAPASAQSPAPQDFPAATSKIKPDARRAKRAYQRGLRAEQAEDWRAAFEAYTEAATYSPGKTDLILRREAARFRIVQQHTDRAEREALAGRMEQAREELRAALQLDPSFSVARERLAQFSPPEPPQAKPAPSPLPGSSEAEAPVQLQPQPGRRDFNHRGDTHTVYEDVARQFGVVASFDPDLPTRPIHFQVRGLDFATAMTLLGQETKTFWRALDAHTFFVAENTPAKRHEYTPVVVRTVLLPTSTTPEGMTETLRLLREIVGITHAELDPRTRTLTLRDSPQNVALAVALLQEIERAPGELLLEIEILEVDRNTARQLGITPPSTAQVITFSPTDVRALEKARTTSELLAIIQRIFGATLPPLVAFGGGQTTFLATLPGAAATFSKTFNLVRSGRRVLLRAEEGQPATFFVGDHFPIALAVLGGSLLPSPPGAPSSQLAFPRSDFPTGTSPVAVVAASFRTGNSQRDLAVANKTSNNVSILLGNPDGSFGTKTDFATGASPVALVASDFNADGKLDLAVVNQIDKTVSILLGQGDGTFKPVSGTLPQTGNGPSAIVAGDFNADGKLDLAVVNQADSTVSIFLGNGDGTFKPRTDFPTGTSPTALVTGDFNADGKLDLAVVNKDANTVSVLLGKSDGTFNAKTDFSTGKSPVAITTGDFNGDSHVDLAVANQADNTVSILLGKGDGTFNAKNDFSTGTSPIALVAADFNLDSRLDLIVANQGSSTISILLGNGDGTLGLRADVSTGNSPSALATADFNQDGRPDLAIANQADNNVSVILNTATFTAPPGGIRQTSFPGAEYEDIGLKVRATPRMHEGNEVTLKLEFEIRSLSGTAINGIPVISNRTVQQTVRLRENEPAVLSGIVEQTETRTITGAPGFAHLPVVGYLGGVRGTQVQDTELLIVITPRALRLPPLTSRSIYAGRGEPSPGGARPPQ